MIIRTAICTNVYSDIVNPTLTIVVNEQDDNQITRTLSVAPELIWLHIRLTIELEKLSACFKIACLKSILIVVTKIDLSHTRLFPLLRA
jgi:hypothetical protein